MPKSMFLKIALAGLCISGILAATVSANAGEKQRARPRYQDFYAYVPAVVPEPPTARPPRNGGCFVTPNQASAARGIRYWRPDC